MLTKGTSTVHLWKKGLFLTKTFKDEITNFFTYLEAQTCAGIFQQDQVHLKHTFKSTISRLQDRLNMTSLRGDASTNKANQLTFLSSKRAFFRRLTAILLVSDVLLLLHQQLNFGQLATRVMTTVWPSLNRSVSEVSVTQPLSAGEDWLLACCLVFAVQYTSYNRRNLQNSTRYHTL